MNMLLKLEFFKSLGFISKESGMKFVKENDKLRKQIEEKVDEFDDTKYEILESIKNEIFPQYDDKKRIFLLKVKRERSDILMQKKQLDKQAMKDELRTELLNEIKNEEMDEKSKKIMKKYPKAMPIINLDCIEKINGLQDGFLKVLLKIDTGDIDKDELAVIEKTKEQVEKAILILMKATKTLESY